MKIFLVKRLELVQQQIVLPQVVRQEIKDDSHTRFVWSCGCITALEGNILVVMPHSSDCVVIERAKEVAEYYGASLQVRPKYEKPVFEAQKAMVFPYKIMEKFNKANRFCLQCSGCHGCR